MTHSGVIATLLSGLEPSVALALACVPFLRPYFGGGFRETKSASYYVDSSGKSHKGSHGAGSRTFEELPDDASEVQLRPIKVTQDTHISASKSNGHSHLSTGPAVITVQKQWEVKSDTHS
jgi:hypothetical protein